MFSIGQKIKRKKEYYDNWWRDVTYGKLDTVLEVTGCEGENVEFRGCPNGSTSCYRYKMELAIPKSIIINEDGSYDNQ
jgi:hypothetical protein